ncbi:MAG: type II toxin-antitoxin system HipA family toxin YjjJ [Rhizobacter sp.]
MRPRNHLARERLETVLSRRAPVSAPDLAASLDISLATARRVLEEQPQHILAAGNARRRRYAMRRALRGNAHPPRLYAIDPKGRATEAGSLSLIRPQGSHLTLDEAIWPVPAESRDGWWDGLPYPLLDMRPQGYMGRLFAHAHSHDLQLDPDPNKWSDDDVLVALSREGGDLAGNLVLGEVAFTREQARHAEPPTPLSARKLGIGYGALAEQALATGTAGSSAGGEFPKFTALRDISGAQTPHVIVKFSGTERSGTVERWSDLLVCEHLALESLRGVDSIEVAASRVVQHGGRTFLESERFDRHGLWGRSPLVSLMSLDAALLGAETHDWPVLAQRLAALGLLTTEQVQQVTHLWWFGRLIANTDMHTGNLSFRPQGTLAIAPAYDMLPMMYAPLPGGELPRRDFQPTAPRPEQRGPWMTAARAALKFWRRAAKDARISDAFRAICLLNAQRLQDLASGV